MQEKINLEKHFFENADIAAATLGYTDGEILRAWIRLGYFSTKMEPVYAGQARKFPLQAVYEAAILAHFARRGLLLRYAAAFSAKFIEEIKKAGGIQKFLDNGKVGEEIFSRCFIWNVEQSEDVGYSTTFLSNNTLEEASKIAGGNGGLDLEQNKLPYRSAECFVIINLSGIIKNVNAILEKRLKEKKE